jgi:hypothetical protein
VSTAPDNPVAPDQTQNLPDPGATISPKVPIVLGITGHRDIRESDRPALTNAVEAILREFGAAYPNSPIILLSSLAAGADQLAAHAALGLAVRKTEVVVRAPLPMPASAYRMSTSFDTEDDRKAFDAMLANHTQVECFTVPPPWDGDPTEAEWEDIATGRGDPEKSRRHACYAAAGVYIVRHCHALIALWDGNDAPQRASGTAEIVKFALSGAPPAGLPNSRLQPLGYRGDRIPVVVVHTPRAPGNGEPAKSKEAGAIEVRLPTDDADFGISLGRRRVAQQVRWPRRLLYGLMPTRLARSWPRFERSSELGQMQLICQTVDDFNSEVARALPGLEERARNAFATCPIPGALGERLRRMICVRECAAHVARALDKKLRRAQVALFLVLLAAVTLFHFYAHWFRFEAHGQSIAVLHEPIFLFVFLSLLFGSMLMVAGVWLSRLEQRRSDYRALAEALRVRRAWALAGIGVSVADSYLGQLRGAMAWTRRALMQICPPPREWAIAFAGLRSADEQTARLREVRDSWVKGQVDNFRRTYKENHHHAVRLRGGGFALAFLGWVMWLTPVVDVGHPDSLHLILSGFLVVAGGILIAVAERRSYEELANQYERMLVVFSNGDRELQKRLDANDVAGAQAVLLALGGEAIIENAQWLILRRARPFELHIG